MFHVVLTSFMEAKKLGDKGVATWSGARSAPDFAKGWPVARWAQPQDREEGFPWLLRDFGGMGAYYHYVMGKYRERWPEMRRWLNARYSEDQVIALCCWCPFSKTARRQLEEFGTFHCHLNVIGDIFKKIGVSHQYGIRHEREMYRHGQQGESGTTQDLTGRSARR